MENETLLNLGGRLKIAPKNILLLRAEINYTKILLDDGSTLLSSITLGTLQKRLQNFSFFRPNRSVIINLEYMIEFKEATAQIKMENDEVFIISRRRTKHINLICNPKSNKSYLS
jgi:DNA-binding LytR/AlgR family response regulator